jgi:hypothetical protein
VKVTDVTALESTPSGDRLFVASSRAALRVIDRFAERETERIPLPAPALAMRMDPDGITCWSGPRSRIPSTWCRSGRRG